MAEQSNADGARPKLPLWRNRDFVTLWSGGLISALGTGISSLSYPFLMLAMTHSPAQAGLTGALRALPYLLLGLPAGALADRWNRKRVMILCDAGRALNMATIPLALWLSHLTAAQLYVNAVVGGILFVFFNVAEAARLPHVVPAEQLPAAAAAEEMMSSAARVVGPPLGGSLYQLGHAVPFLADGLSYAASVLAIFSVKVEFQERRVAAPTHLRREIAEGVGWLWHHPLLRTVAVTTAGLQLAVSGVSLLVIVLAQHQHASAPVIGALFSATGIGGVLGAALAPRVLRALGFGRVILGMMWGEVLLWPFFALAPNPVALGAVLGLFAFTMPIYGVATVSYRLQATPDHLRSRVGSVFRLIAWSSEPLGAALAGVLIQTIGAASTAIAFSGWALAVAGIATLNRRLRRAATSRTSRPDPLPDEQAKETHTLRVCSFCGKKAHEVRWMIAGRGRVIICDDCVTRCNDMIAEANAS